MAEKLYTGTGEKIYISATLPATKDQAGFEAVSWTKIADIESRTAIGKTYTQISFTAMDERFARMFKGDFSHETVDYVMGLNSAAGQSDPGQEILRAARDSDDDFSFKIEYLDNPGGTSNTIRYYEGKVMSWKEQGDRASVGKANISTGVSGEVIEVPSVT